MLRNVLLLPALNSVDLFQTPPGSTFVYLMADFHEVVKVTSDATQQTSLHFSHPPEGSPVGDS